MGLQEIAWNQTGKRLTILVVGTLNTKADEMSALADEIRYLHADPIILDSSVGPVVPSGASMSLEADVTPQQIADAAGIELEAIWAMPRGKAVRQMRIGVDRTIDRLWRAKRFQGAICIGGAGAHLAGPAFQHLPLVVPKLFVTPLASGERQFEPYVGTANVAILHSVTDIAGINAISATIFRQAAGYVVGATSAVTERPPETSDGPLIAISMNGNTTSAVDRARARLTKDGYSVVTFHANGVGGRAMEEMAQNGDFVGIIDFTTTELAGSLFGGMMDPGPTRMEAAAGVGIPQVLVPGCIDLITTGRYEQARVDYPSHRLFEHNPELTLVRMEREQMIALGKEFAAKANLGPGTTSICIPANGYSVPGGVGGPFHDPEADGAFLEALETTLDSGVTLNIVNAHINDAEFVDVVLEEYRRLYLAVSGNGTPPSKSQ